MQLVCLARQIAYYVLKYPSSELPDFVLEQGQGLGQNAAYENPARNIQIHITRSHCFDDCFRPVLRISKSQS